MLEELRAQGGTGAADVATASIAVGDGTASYRGVRLRARDADDARKWGDAFRTSGESGVAVLAAEMPGDKWALFTFVTDDLVSRGVRADAIVKDVASIVGGKGGGRPHMAQAGIEDPSKVDEALAAGADKVRALVAGGAA
jgi:alanyl-tRNA synthetase